MKKCKDVKKGWVPSGEELKHGRSATSHSSTKTEGPAYLSFFATDTISLEYKSSETNISGTRLTLRTCNMKHLLGEYDSKRAPCHKYHPYNYCSRVSLFKKRFVCPWARQECRVLSMTLDTREYKIYKPILCARISKKEMRTMLGRVYKGRKGSIRLGSHKFTNGTACHPINSFRILKAADSVKALILRKTFPEFSRPCLTCS